MVTVSPEIQAAVESIYKIHHSKMDDLYYVYRKGYVARAYYEHRNQQHQLECLHGILAYWKTLSPEDQITFYLWTNEQHFLVNHLSDVQKSAVIIMQDSLLPGIL